MGRKSAAGPLSARQVETIAAAVGAQAACAQQAAGFPLGSVRWTTGKHLGTTRCKHAGLRWSTAGVLDALLALRCQGLNQQLDTWLPPPSLTRSG